MLGGVISKRVATVLKQRVADAEADYKKECAVIDEDCAARIQEIETSRAGSKMVVADELVAKIIG